MSGGGEDFHDKKLQIQWLFSVRAHPQPLTCLDAQGGRILTGSHVSGFFRNVFAPFRG